jgi:inosine/xanthosine triphosphatase
MRIAIGSLNPVKIKAAQNVFERVFGPTEAEGRDVGSGVPSQPFGMDTVQGAINRAKAAFSKDYDYGVGIEAGLFEVQGMMLDLQYCAVYDGEWLTLGCGSGFEYPPTVLNEVLAGKEVGEVMSRVAGVEDLGKKSGAIGFLSKGMLDRTALTEQGVFMALIPRINKELYRH